MPTHIFGYQIPWNDISATRSILGEMITANQEVLWIAGLGFITILIIFLLVREFNCWFWKISTLIKEGRISQSLVNEQNDLTAETNHLITTLTAEIITLRKELTKIQKIENRTAKPTTTRKSRTTKNTTSLKEAEK